MRLLDVILGRATAERAVADGYSMLTTAFASPDSERILPTYLNAAEAYGTSAVVFGVQLARLSLFSEAEFKFQRLEDKGLFGTEALRILEEPWPGGETNDLLARMIQDADLAGNAYVHALRDEGRVERLRPDCVTIISGIRRDGNDDEFREVLGYYYEPPVSEGRKPAFYPVEDVAHWAPIPDPLANFRGMSWLTPVLREVDADTQMTDYKRAFLTNAATPNLLVKYTGKLGPDKMQRLSKQLHARHGGVGNAFKTLILDEGADTTVLGNTFNEMKFADVQAAGENRIAVAAGVPAIVAGLKEGLASATYSNYEQAMRRFVDLTMRPLWRSACGALSRLVEVPADARLWFDTSAIAALRQGDKEQADTMAVLGTAAGAYITAGFEPESVKAALSAGDVTLLKHTGLVSVQLQAPGSTPTPVARSTGEDLEAIVRAASPGHSFHIHPTPIEVDARSDVHVPAAEVVVNNAVQVDATEVTVEPSRAEVVVQAPAPEVRVEVNPTPVTVENHVDVQPAEVTVLPTEPRTRRIERDRKGEIVAVHEE